MGESRDRPHQITRGTSHKHVWMPHTPISGLDVTVHALMSENTYEERKGKRPTIRRLNTTALIVGFYD